MKHLKFTYVDALTGISIASHPAANGPVFPAVQGLVYEWARESQYPTPVPEFFGTCPADSDTQIDGVLGVFSQADWEQMRVDEMAARNKVPFAVSRFQARMALRAAGYFDAVEAMMAAPETPIAAKEAWASAQEFERTSPTVAGMAAALGMTEAQLDALFIAAAQIKA